MFRSKLESKSTVGARVRPGLVQVNINLWVTKGTTASIAANLKIKVVNS